MRRMKTNQVFCFLIYPIFHLAFILLSIRMVVSAGLNPSSYSASTSLQKIISYVGIIVYPILTWPYFILESFGFQHDSIVLGRRNVGDYVGFYFCGIVYAVILIGAFNLYSRNSKIDNSH